MKYILEKEEIKTHKELSNKIRTVCNLADFDNPINFSTEDKFNFLKKRGFTFYVVDIYAKLYERVCEDGEVTHRNPKDGVAQDVIAINLKDKFNDKIPTKEEDVWKYRVSYVFETLMKEKLLWN